MGESLISGKPRRAARRERGRDRETTVSAVRRLHHKHSGITNWVDLEIRTLTGNALKNHICFASKKGPRSNTKSEREREKEMGRRETAAATAGPPPTKSPPSVRGRPLSARRFPTKRALQTAAAVADPAKKDADTARGTAAHSAVAPEFGGRAVTALRASGRVALDWLPPAF